MEYVNIAILIGNLIMLISVFLKLSSICSVFRAILKVVQVGDDIKEVENGDGFFRKMQEKIKAGAYLIHDAAQKKEKSKKKVFRMAP